MIVSIHQPNYMPWLGFFDKIIQSDIFVIFDDVQFPRGKSHFGHRNYIKTNNSESKKYLTVPLIGKSSFKKFNEIEINYNGWNKNHLNLISENYKRSKYYNKYYDKLSDILMVEYESLSDLTSKLIKYFMFELKIDTKVMFSSDICDDTISGADRISFILNELNAKKYISGTGPGSMRYINEKEFEESGIELIWQHYKHPMYTQMNGEFIPYMCILDLLFNEGDNSRNIICNQS
jgi:hypothetical protein